ncbi:MAG: LacI family DNA-binding transcriptional regulator [Clostridia bacterium]|nr:LacI family DNA-binding transcriptional regulator [Clostridia bacterium]
MAKEAGVSVATVSRVINKKGVCSKDTEQAVLSAVEKLGYKPNLFGKALRRSETKIIMVLLSSLANTFCSSVIRSIDRIAGMHGYYTMVCATEGIKEKEEYYINFATNGLFDGIIILNSSLSKAEMSSLSKTIPVVQCNEYIDTKDTPYVSIDNTKAAYDAVSLLISNGRRRIVFYTADNNLVSTKGRFDGYKSALDDNGIPFDEKLVIYGNYGYRNAVTGFSDFLDQGIEFDSIFAISDRMAAGAMSVLGERGIRVPEDVEIVGFDNTDISYTSTPKITTVAQPHHDLGENAFCQLENIISGRHTANVILSHRIVRRDSTK